MKGIDMGGGQDNKDDTPVKLAAMATFEDPEKPSQVDHPEHYNRGTIETIDFIEDRQYLGFSRLNAIKYIDRSGAKIGESKEQSIRKAIWYLERELGMHKKGDL